MKSRVSALMLVFAFLVGLVSLVMLFSIAFPVYAGAEGSGWIRDRRVAQSPVVEENERSPSMATDSRGNLYVAFQRYDPTFSWNPWVILVYNSSDGGDTWNDITPWWFPLGENPSIAIDVGDNDHIFVAYERISAPGRDDHDIYVVRYIDGTWDEEAVDDDGDDDRYPSITSEYWYGESDYLYISYEEVDPYGDGDLMFTKSTDDGENWQTPQKLLEDGNSYSQTSITTIHSKVGEDFIYIAYKAEWTFVFSNISVARSSDRGDSWEHILVYGGTYDVDVNWPSIAATHGTGGTIGGTVVVAWQIYPSDAQREDVWYAWSPDDGDTWWVDQLAEERDVREMSPKLAVDGQDSTSTTVFGYIHVVYLQVYDVDYVDIAYQKVWYDSPGDWSLVEIVNEEHSATFNFFEPWSPAITTQEREGPVYWNRTYACVAWTDFRNQATTGYDIYYSTPGATYTIATDPSTEDLEVQVDGVNYTNSQWFNWPAGYSHIINAPSPQKESQTERYAFTWWSDGGTQSHNITIGTTDLTITANYIKQYKITFEVTTEGPSHTDLNSTNYVTVVYRSCEAFLNVYVWDASPAIVWVDEGSIASYILQSSGSTATHRWYAPTNPSYTITGPATYNPTIWDQYKPLISADVGGSGHDLNSTNYVELTYYRFGSVGTFNVFEGNDYNDWVDAGSTASLSNPSQESTPTHRWFSSGPISWTIDDASTRTATYYEQFKPEISVITANMPKLNSTNYVTVSYIQNDEPKTYDIWDEMSFSDWCDIGSTATLSHPSSGSSSTERWDTDDPTSWTIDAAYTIQVTFYHQYFLTVSSSYGTPGGGGWYEDGSTAYATLDTGTVSGGTGIQHVFTEWSGDASGTNYAESDPIIMDAPKTAIANWKTQYYLTININPLDVPVTIPGEGWYDQNTELDLTAPTPVALSGDTQYRFDHWTIDTTTSTSNTITVTMDDPKTAIAYYVKQFKLTVTSDHDTPVPSVGDHWIDEGDSVTASVTSPADESDGTRYQSTGWTGTGSVPSSGTDTSVTFTMTAPSTIEWNWIAQYYITVTSDHGAPTPSQWVNEGDSLTVSVTSPADDDGAGTRYRCTGYRIDGGEFQEGTSYTFTNVQAAHTITFEWIVQYRVVFTESGIESGLRIGIGVNDVWYGGTTIYNYTEWFDEGSSVTFNITDLKYVPPYDDWPLTRYVLVEWKNAAGSVITSPQTISAPDTFTAHYKAQYRLEVDSPYGTTGGTDYYDSGSTAYATLDTNNVSGEYGIQYIFTEWSGNASGTDYAQSDPIIMDAPKTAVASWKTQYYLTIDARALVYFPSLRLIEIDVDIPGEGWHDEDVSVTLTAPSPVPYSDDTRYRFDHWSIDGTSTDNPITFNMDNPKGVTARYVTQYTFTVISEFGSPVPSAGEHWYDERTYINASITTTISDEFDGTRYSLEGWNGTGRSTREYALNWTETWVYFYLITPSSIEWSWRVQYYLTVETDPTGLSPQPIVSPIGLWYDSGTQVNLTAETIEGYNFDHWDIDGTAQDPTANPISLTMDAPHTATAHYTTAAPAFPLWWLGVIMLIIAAAIVTFILTRKRILKAKTTRKTSKSLSKFLTGDQ